MAAIVSINEKKILKMVKDLHDHPGWLCLHYPLSRLSIAYEAPQKKIALNILSTALEQTECTAFVSTDNDIFIFSRLLKNRPWDQLTHKLRKLLADDPLAYIDNKQPNPQFSKLYSLDIKKEVETLLSICNAKVEAKKKEGIKKPVSPKLDGKVIFDEFLVNSGSKKRVKRDGLQILVVEDEAFSRKLISSVIEKDYTTLTARDGMDALQTYAINFPDIVFLDIQMPDLNGHQVMTEILNHDPDAFIVMLSANSSQKEVISCMKEGAKGFITKPFKRDKLQSYIDKYRTERKKHG